MLRRVALQTACTMLSLVYQAEGLTVPGAGAQIVLNQTYNTYDSEPAWRQCARYVPEFSATVQNWLPAGDVVPLDNSTLRISGVHSHLSTIVDTVINETGALRLHACRRSPICTPRKGVLASGIAMRTPMRQAVPVMRSLHPS